MKGKTHDLNHHLTFFAHTINLLCHSISLMFRVLGIYNFGVLEKGRKETLSYSFLVKLQTKYFQWIYCIMSLVTGLSDNVWKIVLNFLLYDVKIANWRHIPLHLTLFKFSSALIWTTKEYLDPLCHWVNTTARISPPKNRTILYIYLCIP